MLYYIRNQEEIEKEKESAIWALSEPESEYKLMDETPYDIVDYNMW